MMALLLLSGGLAFAGEYYVSPSGDNKNSGDERNPFRTIQYAVDKAGSGETIILLPGDHVEGLTENSAGRSRVYINNKQLVIKSKEGRATRDSTRIVGAWSDNDDSVTPVGMGDAAIRCVYVTSTGTTGTRFEGVTFYRGSSQYGGSSSASDSQKLHGGGLCCAAGTGFSVEAVDCAFVECQATRGGGYYTDQAQSVQESPVRAVRCLFKDCRASKYGEGQRGGCAYNCIYDGNGPAVMKDGTTQGTSGALDFPCQVVNCTFVQNRNNAIAASKQIDDGVWNCLFVFNDGASMAKKTTSCAADYCVYEGVINGSAEHNAEVDRSMNPEIASISTGDYRLAPGALALTTASAEKLDLIPEAYRSCDFLGNDRKTDDRVYCGAVQGVISQPGLVLAQNENISWVINGKSVVVAGSLFVPTQGFVPMLVKASPADDGSALVRYGLSGNVLWPKMDDSVWVLAPETKVLTAISTRNVYWINPMATANGNGTKANPFWSLAAIQDNFGTGDNLKLDYVFRVMQGDCDKEYVQTTSLGRNRLYVGNKYSGNMRIQSVDGPDVTFITGASDVENPCRCAYVAANLGDRLGNVSVQGFTIRNGRTKTKDVLSSAEIDDTIRGGALLNREGSQTACLVDCVIDDCTARCGLACYGGVVERCKVRHCVNSASDNYSAVFYGTKVRSSLVTACGSASYSSAPLFQNADVVNVTAYGNYQYATANGFRMPIVNSIMAGRISGTAVRFTNQDMVHTLYDQIFSDQTTGAGCMQENPIAFKSAAKGDFRLKAKSSGVVLGIAERLASLMDINGNHFAIDENGKCAAGCFAEVVPTPGLVFVVR